MHILNENHDGGKNLLGHAVIIKKLPLSLDFWQLCQFHYSAGLNLNSIFQKNVKLSFASGCIERLAGRRFFCMIRRNRWEKGKVTDL